MPATSSASGAQSPSPSPSPPPPSTTSEITRLTNLLTQTENELRNVEASILTQEAAYIRNTALEGNAIRGWEDYVRKLDRRMGRDSVGGANDDVRQKKNVKAAEKLFSSSSSTGGVANIGAASVKKGGRKKNKGSSK